MFDIGRRLYISNFAGLGNRLEALVLAGMIEDYYGHAIHLDWPEADCLRVAGTRQGSIRLWERLAGRKIRDFDERELETFGSIGVINLRATYGPRELQRRYLLPTAARLRPHPAIRRAIRETLAPYGARPAVAVHVRHGDFHVPEEHYDATGARHPGVPLWWYEHVMAAYARLFPGVYFVMGYSGEDGVVAHLRSRFDVVTLPPVFGYRTLLAGHASSGHPVTDLFGLACCTTLIATPTSSYSHWSANLLGPATVSLLPPPRMTCASPAFAYGMLQGGALLDWRDAAEQGRRMRVVAADGDVPVPSAAVTDWL